MGLQGGGTITGTNTEPTLEMYENIFGPSGRDIKIDSQRHKRHQRWHLPDALKGHNQYLTDRVDGLITDATNSPFTRNILPYVYLENPDQKLKWNVYSFDEGIASRVPYEAAARVLPQSKRSFAGYTVRQGLAIAMEHNFMASAAGQQNFKNQLTQLVGSIQLTNDLDVHVALLTAPSHQKFMNERYHDQHKTTAQICREYVDMFGILQKVPNALDIIIEDAKNTLKTWGSPAPTFLLCNGALTTQLTMTPEVTNYLTNGPDGKARLAKGPDLPSYRGLQIINSRKFSMDSGTAPRDLLRRRVRVAEYYHIPWNERCQDREYEFYDQSRDTMFRLSWDQLLEMSNMAGGEHDEEENDAHYGNDVWYQERGQKRVVPRTPGTDLSIEDGGILAASTVVQTLTLGDVIDPATGAPNPGQQPISARENTGLYFYGALHRSGDAGYKRVRASDVTEKSQARITPNYFNTLSDKKQHYADQTETFGGGLFREVIMKDVQVEKRIARMPVLKGVTEENNAMNVAAILYEELMQNPVGDIRTIIDRYSRVEIQHDLFDSQATGDTNRNKNYCLWSVIKHMNASSGGTKLDTNPNWEDTPIEERRQLFKSCLQWMNYDNAKKQTEAGGAGWDRQDIATRVNANLVPSLRTYANWTSVYNSLDPVVLGVGNVVYNRLDAAYPGDLRDLIVQIILAYCELYRAWSYDAVVDSFSNALVDWKSNSIIDDTNRQMKEMSNHILMSIIVEKLQGVPDIAALVPVVANRVPTDTFKNDYKFNNFASNVMLGMKRGGTGIANCIPTCMPNLHLSTCNPLKYEHAVNSASSANPAMWLIQQVAGMVELNSEVCERLLSATEGWNLDDMAAGNLRTKYNTVKASYTGNSFESSGILDRFAYISFLLNPSNGDLEPLSQNPIWDSFLMHWFMSYFHPSEAIRDRAAAKAGVSKSTKGLLCSKLADILRTNDLNAGDLNNVLKEIVPPTFNKTGNCMRYTTGIASNTMPSVTPQTLTPGNVKVSTKRNWQDIPATAGDGFAKLRYYNARDGNPNDHLVQQAYNCWEARFYKLPYPEKTGDPAAPLATDRTVLYDPEQYKQVDKDTLAYTDGVWEQPQDVETNPSVGFIETCVVKPWLKNAPKGLCSSEFMCSLDEKMQPGNAVYDGSDPTMNSYAQAAQGECHSNSSTTFDDIIRHFLLVMFARFFEDSSRFMDDGRGACVPINTRPNQSPRHDDGVIRNGLHFMHGPWVPCPISNVSQDTGNQKDIVILRPNIEHEMLGVVMGRGGTQELGATFWGQTELSCYDDSQHGIWGMSYKYHERAMVTNERNLIRVFDVAFDGYNGGMDQEYVDWTSSDSRRRFAECTYAKDRPYSGPSMLVMALPHNPKVTRCNWPNPVVFHKDMSSNPTPDPQKNDVLPDVEKYMVFNATKCPKACTPAQETAYNNYMQRLEMTQWASLDSSSRPAGDCCVANESTSNMLAFQGTMKVFDKSGGLVEHIQGSGHLGPSYVGVASIREGRGIQNTHMQPQMIRQI